MDLELDGRAERGGNQAETAGHSSELAPSSARRVAGAAVYLGSTTHCDLLLLVSTTLRNVEPRLEVALLNL